MIAFCVVVHGVIERMFVDFNTIRVWVQIRNLPPALKSKNVVRNIGTMPRTIIIVDGFSAVLILSVVCVQVEMTVYSVI